MPEITSTNKENNSSNIIDEKKYDIWINKLYNKIPLSYQIISLFFGLTIFVLGIIISYFNNFYTLYISSTPVYLGLAGIILVSASMEWGAKNYVRVLNQVRPYFNVSDEEYLETTEKWLKLISNDKLILSLSSFFIILTYLIVFIVYHYKISMLMVFPNEWYLPPTFYKILIIDIFGTVIILLLVTSGASLIINTLLMNDLGKKPVFFYPNLTQKLKPLSDFNLIAAITWFIGNALIIRLFYSKFNVITLPIELILLTIGLLTFFVPQISLHGTLRKSREKVLHSIDNVYEEHYKLICEAPNSLMEQTDLFMKFYALDKTRAIITTQSKTWIYDTSSMLKLLGPSLLIFYQTIVSIIVKYISIAALNFK
jgi:hypothetical protein